MILGDEPPDNPPENPLKLEHEKNF